jgi:programmed cell death protein 4
VCNPDAVLDDDLPDFDEKDPLFDDHQKPYILSAGAPTVEGTELQAGTTNGAAAGPRGFDPIARAKVYGPMLTLAEFKIQLASTLKEYFDSCDADEVIRSLVELKCHEYHPEIVKKAVSISLDKGPRERELVSRLLTCLHPSLLSLTGMEAGFTLLLDSLDDLSTDVPEAKV